MSSLIVEVCKIEESVKHPNADRLSVVKIKGWYCVTGLDQYKVNDLVVFVPPDSIVPDELIEKYELVYLKGKNRITTQKLRGFTSQGLVIDPPPGNWKVGDDVAKVLGITKYEQPEPNPTMRGNMISKKKLNPLFDIYTDIENIKNFNSVFEDGEFVFCSEKLHGSNIRFANLPINIHSGLSLKQKISLWFKKYILREKYEFVWGSHNVQLQSNSKTYYGEDIYGKMAGKYNMKEITPKDTIIYGEVFGKGVQDLEYGLDHQEIRIFDIKSATGNYWHWADVEKFCKENGLQTVPVLYIGPYKTDILEKCTVGMSVICPTQIREGAVIRPLKESNHPRIGRKILKSINPDYLMRKNATEFH